VEEAPGCPVRRGLTAESALMANGIPIILLSGMAADERLFTSQLAAFPNLRVQPWIPPRPGASLREYAARLAPLIDPRRPCIVGGASFGGLVALELVRHLPVRSCILIGSVRSPADLPWRWRVLRPVALLGPDALRVLAAASATFGRRFLARGRLRALRRLASPEAEFLRWALCAVMRWRPGPIPRGVPVYHIHGSADRVLPVARARPDVVVPGGAHALSLFNPTAVNDFIAGVVRAVLK
jgi:pimeloyl-ACP methyl ester carboxylesterase